jgi:uncharacterized protein with PIN domain
MSKKDQTRFIADVMVGRLARYLRMAGYDVVYMNDADDGLIIKIAVKEDRIVLTRDTMMLERKEFKNGTLRSVFITDDSLAEQLLQVKTVLTGTEMNHRFAFFGPDRECLLDVHAQGFSSMATSSVGILCYNFLISLIL